MEEFNRIAEDLQFRFPYLDIEVNLLNEDETDFPCFYANTKGEKDYREFAYELDDSADWVRGDVAWRIALSFPRL